MLEHLKALAIFARIVETGSFRAAARSLAVSPSVVSEQITALEGHLGVALLYRSTRGFALTNDGKGLLPFAQSMVDQAQTGISSLTEITTKPIGQLRISVPSILSMSPIVQSLASFSREYPDISLSLSFSDAIKDLIRDGLDLSIRIGWLKDSSLKSKKLGVVGNVLVASSEYAAQHPVPKSPKDLERWKLVHLIQHKRYALNGPDGVSSVLNCPSSISVDNVIAARQLALAGAGLAPALEFAVRDDLKSGRLVRPLPAWELEPIGVYAVWPPNTPRLSLTSLFVDFLAGLENQLAPDIVDVGT